MLSFKGLKCLAQIFVDKSTESFFELVPFVFMASIARRDSGNASHAMEGQVYLSGFATKHFVEDLTDDLLACAILSRLGPPQLQSRSNAKSGAFNDPLGSQFSSFALL